MKLSSLFFFSPMKCLLFVCFVVFYFFQTGWPRQLIHSARQDVAAHPYLLHIHTLVAPLTWWLPPGSRIRLGGSAKARPGLGWLSHLIRHWPYYYYYYYYGDYYYYYYAYHNS